MNKNVIFPLLTTIIITGCNGGGGSSPVLSAASSPFVKWSALAKPTTVMAQGISQEGTFTAPAPDYAVTGSTDQGTNTYSSATFSYRADGTISRVKISTPNNSLTWNEDKGDVFVDKRGAISLVDPSKPKIGLAVDATDPNVDWDYQTFGMWLTGYGTSSGTFGAISVGAPTAGSAIPTTGNASFTGATAGYYIDSTGTNFYTTASDMTIDADFNNRTLDFRTTDTSKVHLTTAIDTTANNLIMSGTLTYAAGTNSFTGKVTATGLTGTSTGRFYGPGAEELGGVFSLTGTDVELYGGSYGAKR